MKKLVIAMLILSLTLCFAACGNSAGGADTGAAGTGAAAVTEPDAPATPEVKRIADDLAVPGMSFVPPEGFVSVERTLDKADGKLTAKDLQFNYADGGHIDFAYATGYDLSQMSGIENYETEEHGGVTFYNYTSGSTVELFGQVGDVLYGIEYEAGEGVEGRELLDRALEGLKFEDVESVTENVTEIEGIKYTLDTSLNIASTFSANTEDADGNLIRNSMTWRFGEDDDNLAYRLLLRRVAGAKVEDELSSDYAYEDGTLGELPCKVRKDSDGNIVDYYIQVGDNVYIAKNMGVSTGWSTDRSEESHAAFAAFVGSFVFDD